MARLFTVRTLPLILLTGCFHLFLPPVSARAAEPLVVIGDTTTLEGGRLEFPVTLAAPAAHDVSFRFRTGHPTDTAQAHTDYVPGSGQVTVFAGSTQATLSIPVVSDGLPEEPETVTVTLYDAEGASLLAAHDRVLVLNGVPGTEFAQAAALHGHTLAVGAPLERRNPESLEGAIHIFDFHLSDPEAEPRLRQTLWNSGSMDAQLGHAFVLSDAGLMSSTPTHFLPFHRHSSEPDAPWTRSAGSEAFPQTNAFVSAFGTTAALGGDNRIHIFTQSSPGVWRPDQMLTLPQLDLWKKVRYGRTLAVGLNEIFVVEDKNDGTSTGQIHRYRREEQQWIYDRALESVGQYNTPGEITLYGDVLVAEDYHKGEIHIFERDFGGSGNWGLRSVLPQPTGLGDRVTAGPSLIATSSRAHLAQGVDLTVYHSPASGEWVKIRDERWADPEPVEPPGTLVFSGSTLLAGFPREDRLEIRLPHLVRGTIVDGALPHIVCHDTRKDEPKGGDQGAARFSVILKQPSERAITVHYRTRDGSATATEDYGASEGVLVFEPGQVSQTVTIPLFPDRIVESEEHFFLELTAPSIGTLLGTDFRCFIRDRPYLPDPVLRVEPPETILEGDGGSANDLVFALTLSFPAPNAVTGRFAIRSATDDPLPLEYFENLAGEFSIPAGAQSGELRVHTLGDDVPELHLDAALVVSDLQGAVLEGDYGISSSLTWPDDPVTQRMSASLNGDTLVTGYYSADHPLGDAAGRVQVHRRQADSWVLQQEFSSPEPRPNEYFGQAVAVEGDRLLVAAEFAESTGSVIYIFERSGPTEDFQFADLIVHDLRHTAGDKLLLVGSTAAAVFSDRLAVFERKPGGRWDPTFRTEGATLENCVLSTDTMAVHYRSAAVVTVYRKQPDDSWSVVATPSLSDLMTGIVNFTTMALDSMGRRLSIAASGRLAIFERDLRGPDSWSLAAIRDEGWQGVFLGDGFDYAFEKNLGSIEFASKDHPSADAWGPRASAVLPALGTPMSASLVPNSSGRELAALLSPTRSGDYSRRFVTLAPDRHHFTLLDDDLQISLRVDPVIAGGSATVTAELPEPAPFAFSVLFHTVPGSARPGVDYTTTSAEIQFAAGATKGAALVSTFADPDFRGVRTLSLVFTSTAGIPDPAELELRILSDPWVELRPLVAGGAMARFLAPAPSGLEAEWTGLTFDDSAWSAGPTGVGFDRTPGGSAVPWIGSDLFDSVYGQGSGVYLRLPFHLPRPVQDIVLRVVADDGWVAWINGSEVARHNAPDQVTWNSTASEDVGEPETVVVDLQEHAGILRAGQTNLLAVQGLNSNAWSTDFLLYPELLATLVAEPPGYDEWIRQVPRISPRSWDWDADPDRDKLPNGVEFSAGTNPGNPHDATGVVPHIEGNADGTLSIEWLHPVPRPGYVHILEWSPILPNPSWQTVAAFSGSGAWSGPFPVSSLEREGRTFVRIARWPVSDAILGFFRIRVSEEHL